MRKPLIFVTLLLISTLVFGAPDKDAPTTHHKIKDVTYSGYIDASYNDLVRSNRFISGDYDRFNDTEPNGFSLQQAALTVEKNPEQGVGGLVTLIIGRDANRLAPSGFNPDILGIKNIGFDIPQAYLLYVKNAFTFKVGELLSLAGVEQFDYTQDTHFSRSILYGYAEPGSHVGFRVIDKINDKLSLIVGLNNGWSTIQQIAHQNTAELGISYIVHPSFTLVADVYSGKQYVADYLVSGPTGWRSLLDVYAIWDVTDKLSFGVNYDFGQQSRAQMPDGQIDSVVWKGIAGYLNYKINGKWRTSLRAELFNDSDGYRTGVRQNWRELTWTLGYIPRKDLEIRAETRHDFSNVNAYLLKNKVGMADYQQSYALEIFYTFL